MAHELAQHDKESDCWMAYNGKLLNVTGFLDQHPGGKDLLVPYYGKDITEAFDEADHSETAVRIMEDLVIGGSSTRKTPKIDPYRGVVYQVWRQMNLKQYTEFINKPQHVEGHIRVFDNSFLELFSMTPWWVVPLIWIPASLWLLHSAVATSGNDGWVAFGSGLAWWTLLEYLLHRFLFHSEPYLPDLSIVITLHFLFHGIHHAFPMDNLRLVFPPFLSLVLYVFVKGSINLLFEPGMADGVMAGTLIGYVFYDLFHYYSHHAAPTFPYFAFMKVYHMTHHYKNPDAGYGVSSHFWDVIFGTTLELSPKELK